MFNTISIEPVDDNVTLEDRKKISVDNIRIAEMVGRIDYIIWACEGWLNVREGLGYQDLETYLRNHGHRSYVMATSLLDDNKQHQSYTASFLAKASPQENLEYMKREHNSYETNFEKLKTIKISKFEKFNGSLTTTDGDSHTKVVYSDMNRAIFKALYNVGIILKIAQGIPFRRTAGQ